MVSRALRRLEAHLGLCFGYVLALARGSCRVSDQGTTLRASDLHNAREAILNPNSNIWADNITITEQCIAKLRVYGTHCAMIRRVSSVFFLKETQHLWPGLKSLYFTREQVSINQLLRWFSITILYLTNIICWSRWHGLFLKLICS